MRLNHKTARNPSKAIPAAIAIANDGRDGLSAMRACASLLAVQGSRVQPGDRASQLWHGAFVGEGGVRRGHNRVMRVHNHGDYDSDHYSRDQAAANPNQG